MTPACETCRYWDNSATHRDDAADITGLCRAFPPQTDDRTGLAVWPYTEDTDWCGGFMESEPRDIEGITYSTGDSE